jgi:uncharacterized damage-inducible protein DinB
MPKLVIKTLDLLDMTDNVRDLMTDLVTDDDLAYKLPGNNPSLGALFRDIGQIQQSYIESFKTFTQSFDYPAVDPAIETSVSTLKAWYQQLDEDLHTALQALSDEELQNRLIERGHPMHYSLSASDQMLCYREALMIFYGRATLYLRALGKTLPQQIIDGIG